MDLRLCIEPTVINGNPGQTSVSGNRTFFPLAGQLQEELFMEVVMATCEVCNNEYDKSFEITMAGATHTFDSFECAIHALAPTCNHCGCRIVGHGVEGKTGVVFCCANCAKIEGVNELRDRVS
jgi:hypothetical protein